MDFPLGYLFDHDRNLRIWVNHLAYDDLLPFNEEDQRTPGTGKHLVYVSAAGRDFDLKRMAKSIRDGNELSFRANRAYHCLSTTKHLPFQSWSTPLAGTYLHGLFIHPAATRTYTGRSPVSYLLLPPGQSTLPHDPPAGFFESLNRVTPLPLKPSWEPTLWRLAVQHGWALLCPGYHSHVLRIEPAHGAFTTLLQQAIANKQLR